MTPEARDAEGGALPVRWSAVLTGGLLGAGAYHVLLALGPSREASGLRADGAEVWWTLVPLLVAGLAAGVGARGAGLQPMGRIYLHGLLAWAAALLLAGISGLGTVGLFPVVGLSALAGLLGAGVGAAAGRALGVSGLPLVRHGESERLLPRLRARPRVVRRADRTAATGGTRTHEDARQGAEPPPSVH